MSDVMEQIEIDWRFSSALQAADNELLTRTLIDRVYSALGLEVTFQAKPIEGVAGNGEHTHVGMAVRLTDGSIRNLFSPLHQDQDYLSEVGYGAIMGLLKHWEAIGPFVTCSTDAFNRLKPGFEAPVNLAYSSRNRSAAIRISTYSASPKAKRIEARFPDPTCNPYLAFSAMLMAGLDGIKNKIHPGDAMDKNPLFQDGDLIYDGIIFREIPEFYQARFGSGTNPDTHLSGVGTSSIDVGVNFLCGAQAIGNVNKQAATPITKKEDDYGFFDGVGVEFAYGLSKLRWNNNTAGSVGVAKDLGVCTVYCSATPDT